LPQAAQSQVIDPLNRLLLGRALLASPGLVVPAGSPSLSRSAPTEWLA